RRERRGCGRRHQVPAMQPAEIQFAQRLASHEKGVRERAARRLRQYLSVKTQRETGGFSHEELLKIWKGLFYCMWVQDEPLLQEELAVTISHLVHAVNNSEAQRLFLQTFWQTLNREWAGIDGPRLDKYHTLIRLVLRQSLEVLKRNSWEESRIQLFLDVLMKEVLHPESQAPNGVKFHFIDIYLDELSAVGGKELPADQNLKLIDPLCRIAAKTKDHMLVQTIARAVLEAVIHRSPLAPEETVAGQQAEAAGTRGAAPGRCPSRSDGAREGGAGHAGSPEDEGRLLQFDYKAVADRLLEMTSRKNTPPFNRKWLSRLVQKFQGLSEAGHVVQLSLAEDEDDGRAPGRGAHKRKRGSEPGQACGSENQRDQNLKLIDPLCRIAAKTKDHMLVQTIARAVLEAVIHRSPLAPEETVAGQQAEAAGTRGAAGAFSCPTGFRLFAWHTRATPGLGGGGPGREFTCRLVLQLKAPPSSKKVTFGLSRNMTAEFRKTDRSILVSPEGLSRVAFNPEQRPLHGVLKTPTGSPASPPLGPRKLPAAVPSRRPRAVDFF
ncbi:PREDICTED: ribosomal RNA processing protein 1 homolog B, partial [Condylura cristata]|uniref:ribosomal RNA processing protein 1 homolog B n=1 Tax=Condylura cristata TaxID=143302 RepID=UPI00064380FB